MKKFQNFNDTTFIAIDDILKIEWKMFDNTQNIGGRAECQNNKEEFLLARKNQFFTWNDDLIKSYLIDLINADNRGINLISQKYAYMMKYTHKEEYDKIKKYLLPISEFKEKAVDEIAKIQVMWMEEVIEKYPNINHLRPVHSYEDTEEQTSFETYLKGELYSYSDDTIYEYVKYIKELCEINENMQNLLLINSFS